jgi:hypothetical protein
MQNVWICSKEDLHIIPQMQLHSRKLVIYDAAKYWSDISSENSEFKLIYEF